MPALKDLRDTFTGRDTKNVSQFLHRVRRLHAEHRREFADALGNPPDIKNIPAKTWRKLREQEIAMLMILLMGGAVPMMMLNAGRVARQGFEGGSIDQLRQQMQRLARARARWAASQIMRTNRSRLQQILDRSEELGEDLAADVVLDAVLDDRRNRLVAQNEFVAAQTIGVSAVADLAKRLGIEVAHVWMLGPCKHCTVCPMLSRTDVSFWERFTPGPPLHVNCCCNTQVIVGNVQDLTARGILLPPPSSAAVRAEMRSNGFEIRPRSQ